jgi:hypothetical protein
MPGPAPKHPSQVRRRNAPIAGQLRLPSSGRQGEPPTWPLGRPNAAEKRRWALLWRKPQAVAWERLGCEDAVARYARLAARGEGRDAPMSLLAELHQMEDRLGLTPMALLRLRWEIVDEEPAEEGRVLDVRERLRAVE